MGLFELEKEPIGDRERLNQNVVRPFYTDVEDYDWTDVTDDALIRAIHLDVPDWEPDHGLCERCFEMYELRSLTQA